VKPLRLFVTATDTGVGKTEVSCALLRALRGGGHQPAALKPYESGGSSDSQRLWRASGSGQSYEQTFVHQLKAPLAPAIAARLEKKKTSFTAVARAFKQFDGKSLVVEGAGGLFVPVDEQRDIIDVIAALELPTVLVARAGLGTLNHVALSLGALAGRNIPVLAVVLVKSTKKKDPSERFNAEWISKRHGVTTIGPVAFESSARKRAEAFDRALTKWLRSR
jgi:dethiobiotin synthetase